MDHCCLFLALEIGEDLVSVFTEAHVANGSVDRDGADVEAFHDLAETLPLIEAVGARMAHRSLKKYKGIIKALWK